MMRILEVLELVQREFGEFVYIDDDAIVDSRDDTGREVLGWIEHHDDATGIVIVERPDGTTKTLHRT